jgi:hypothetical protein
MRSFVGFYWTFPVRWAGFTHLSADADEAAMQSRTIAYQQALVRRYVSGERGRLIAEVTAIEVSPDRGTEALEGDIVKAGRLCREHGATLAYVDFQVNRGWRPHPFIRAAVQRLDAGHEAVPVAADEVLNGFDPEEHFSMWRVQDREERERRRTLVPAALRAALREIPEGRGRYGRIATLLNAQGIPTANGGAVWTSETARKALQKLADPELESL